IDIANEGKSIRILSTWVNGTNEQDICSPILDKIENTLQRWEKWRPTIEGRKIIIQRTVGSMSLYLATAQGMPKEIEDLLIKRSRKFAWDSKGNNSASINILYAPVKEG
ncbi:uncharacterized protein HD556DRAFT_1188518, partial [Suillus plorans]